MISRPRFRPEELRAYAKRDWESPARLALPDRVRLPVEVKVRLSIELYEATRATRPDWPDEANRQADRQTHERIRVLLNRAAHVRAR